jgi:hypothetical protein
MKNRVISRGKWLLLVAVVTGSLLPGCQKVDLLLPAEIRSAAANNASGETLSAAVAANQSPYYWSNLMITNVTPENNIYTTTNSLDSVRWTGVNGATSYFCRTDCSGLITQLLKQTYGYSDSYFQTWTGLKNPYAVTYYNEIKAKDHFSQISTVTNIQQGDIIAIKYPTSASNTGHTMLVAAAPTLRSTATAPLITGTRQYEVSVIDQSSSGHGSTDTRYISSGNFNDGIGRGIFRLYVNSKGAITGYTWSTYTTSVYYSQSERQLIVGRLIP